jgi:hypothetical protein
MPPIRKMPLLRWQRQTHRRMSNQKQIPKAKSGGELLVLWLVPSLLPRPRPATFLNASLEYGGNPGPLQRQRLAADVEHDEPSIRNFATAPIGNSASDRSTPSVL